MLTRPHTAVLVCLLLGLSAQAVSAPLAPDRSASQGATSSSADGASATPDALHSIPDAFGLGAELPASSHDQTMRDDEKLAPWGAHAPRQVNAIDGAVTINGAPDESWIRATLGYVRDNALTTLIAMLTLFGLAWLFSAALHYVNTSVPRLYDVRQRRRRHRHSHDSTQEASRSSAPVGTHHSSRRSSRERDDRQPDVKRERRRRRHSRPQP